MIPYIIRRLFVLVGMLFALSVVTFLLFYLVPADPARTMCGVHCTPDIIASNRAMLELDQPLVLQYFHWIRAFFLGRDFATGFAPTHCSFPCLGYSWKNARLVTEMIGRALPVTIYLAIGAFLSWMLIGVTSGVLAARFKGSIFDRGVMVISLIFFSLPTYLIGLFTLLFIVVKWQWLDYPRYTPPSENFGNFLSCMVLPCISLAILYAAYYTRLTRSQMLDTMSEDFIRTARSKGLAEKVVVRRHALRAGLTPIVSSAGLDFAGLLGGAIITERIFGLPGLGSVAVKAVGNLDLPVLVAITLLGGVFVVVANLIVDIMYALIDPRVTVK